MLMRHRIQTDPFLRSVTSEPQCPPLKKIEIDEQGPQTPHPPQKKIPEYPLYNIYP